VAFAETPADMTLLEVGLGGRLDATNVIEAPRLTVITPVDMDHQQFLGDTLGEIAAEKAGIIKRGVPVVVGRQQDAALEVIEARARAAWCADPCPWTALACLGGTRSHDLQDETGLLDLPLPALPGAHQIENAGTAIAALRALGHGERPAKPPCKTLSGPPVCSACAVVP
jgi:dihydrofolate synthase/folylpolyglutamate synthase